MPPENLPIEQPQNPAPEYSEYFVLARFVPRIVAGLLCIVLIIIGGTLLFKRPQTAEPISEATSTSAVDSFTHLSLQGQSALVWDARDQKILYGREADRVLPLASVSKVMTAIAAYQNIPADDIITISSSALATEGESGLLLGERWNRDDLISFVLVTSSNDGAAALAEHYNATRIPPATDFVYRMNDIARDQGFLDTVFVNPTGLDGVYGAPVNRGSARDIARLFAYAMQTLPDSLDMTRFEHASISSLSQAHQITNTNTIIDDIPLAIGSKTGFTDSAGGNLVLSFDADIGHPVILVVLGSSRDGRFSDMQKLIKATRTYFLDN